MQQTSVALLQKEVELYEKEKTAAAVCMRLKCRCIVAN